METDVPDDQVNLRFLLTLNGRTQESTAVVDTVPEYLKTTLDIFGGITSDRQSRRESEQAPRTPRLHMSQTAKELLVELDGLTTDQQQGDPGAVHPRVRLGLIPTMEVAKSIGLRNETETCAAIALQALARCHLTRREQRMKMKVALWAQKCYQRARDRVYVCTRDREMDRIRTRLAIQSATASADDFSAGRELAQSLSVKQQKWTLVDERFCKFKEEKKSDEFAEKQEARALRVERKRAEAERIRIKLEAEQSAIITDAKRTVWVGQIPFEYASEHVLTLLVELLGTVVSVHLRVKPPGFKSESGKSNPLSWALVMFDTSEEAERACSPKARAELGAGVMKLWVVAFVQQEKIQSLRAQITLSEAIDDNVVVETKAKRVKEKAVEMIARDEARVLRAARKAEIAQKWEAINREQELLTQVDEKAREIKRKKEELKMHHQLLVILLHAWGAWANLRTRVNREVLHKDGPSSFARKESRKEIDERMAEGTIDVGRQSGAEADDSSSSALQKMDPALKLAAMKAFATGQRLVIKAFCSWKVYMGALRADRKASALIRKAAWSWDFYLLEARDFGIKVKLDRLDGLIEHASVHEAFSPKERHERHMRRRMMSASVSHTPGAAEHVGGDHIKAAAAMAALWEGANDSTSSSDSDDDANADNEPPPPAPVEDKDEFVAPTRPESKPRSSSVASISRDDSPPKRPQRSMSMGTMLSTAAHRPARPNQEEQISEEAESNGIRWSSAEKDLLGSIFPGALVGE